MKKILISVIVISVFLLSGCKAGKKNEKLKGDITVATAENTSAFIKTITGEFMKNYPNVRIDVIVMDADMYVESALLNEMVNVGVVSVNSSQNKISRKVNCFYFAKDAVVGIVNSGNPVIEKLLNNGIRKKEIENIFINGNVSWGSLGNSENKDLVNAYIRIDECPAAETWACFLGKKTADLKGIKTISENNMISAVEKDKNGIGFVNLNAAYASGSKFEREGLKIVPIDKNENGILDDKENFTFRKDSVIKAIYQKRYPAELTEDIILIVKKGKTNDIASELIKWMLTDGQAFINDAGFAKTSDNKIQESLKNIK